MGALVLVWRWKDNLQELGLSFHHVESGLKLRLLGLVDRPFLLSKLTGPTLGAGYDTQLQPLIDKPNSHKGSVEMVSVH